MAEMFGSQTFKLYFERRAFTTNLRSINSSAWSINESTDSVAVSTCSETALDEYIAELDRIAALLGKYKSLIALDTSDIREAGERIMEMDEAVSGWLR